LGNASPGAAIAGPSTATVTIVDNEITGVAGSLRTTVLPTTPPDSSGALMVSLQPTNANGQWHLLGELNWHENSAVVSGLISANYSVEFRPVNGYRSPGNLTVPVSAGRTNRFTFFYAPISNLETGD